MLSQRIVDRPKGSDIVARRTPANHRDNIDIAQARIEGTEGQRAVKVQALEKARQRLVKQADVALQYRLNRNRDGSGHIASTSRGGALLRPIQTSHEFRTTLQFLVERQRVVCVTGEAAPDTCVPTPQRSP